MDVDRYITDAYERHGYMGVMLPTEFLRRVLPGILAAHRADVLREAAETFDPSRRSVDELTRSAVAHALHRMADEAVAE